MNKILIRGTNWIGDAIMTLPAVASIRATYPQAHIALLAKHWVADIYRLFSDLDDVIIYEDKFDTPTGVFRLAKKLKKENFDAAILLQNAIEAAIIALAAGIPLRAGYDSDARGFLLTHRVRRTQKIKNVHQTEYYLEMVKSLGCVPVAREMHLETKINPIAARKVLKKFVPETEKRLMGIAPGATYGAAKKWFPERFAQLTDRLMEAFPGRTIILGGNGDRKTAQEIDALTDTPLINLAGKTTLTEAAYLISQCRLFISNDSGLMHIAGALNVPTIAIFGSTNPVTTSPLGSQSVVIRKEVSCSPCLKETCPTDFRCMKLISVEDVFRVAQELMRDKRSEKK
ncbi:MAG: lipopolysaccharide heptosyltransferase II [Smithella sp.]|nr:lipopolysaccharide heptosyltransferase II [Smithella sp.]